MKYISKPSVKNGFTIVELLVVIVVIGILATVSLVSYGSLSNKATVASIKSDLTIGSRQLKVYHVNNDMFPATLDCGSSPAVNSICIKSNSYTYIYTTSPPYQTFKLRISHNGIVYEITQDSEPYVPPMFETGGVISNSGDYRIHTFSSNSNITATDSGTIEVDIRGAGGGGGGGTNHVEYDGFPGNAGGNSSILHNSITYLARGGSAGSGGSEWFGYTNGAAGTTSPNGLTGTTGGGSAGGAFGAGTYRGGTGGSGGKVTGNVNINAGDVLSIVVGSGGSGGAPSQASGAAGGSGVDGQVIIRYLYSTN